MDTLSVLVVPVAIFAAVAATRTAKRKGFSQIWAWAVLVFTPIYLWLMVRRSKTPLPGADDVPALTTCAACHADISRQAPACPRCGHPQKLGPNSRRPSLLELAAAMSVVLLTAALFWDGAVNAGNSLPTCASERAKSEVSRIMDESVSGKTLGLKIIRFDSVSEISSTPLEVKCRMGVTLNTAQSETLATRFYYLNGQMYIEFKSES